MTTHRMTRAERETIIRWDVEDPTVILYTADPVQARYWQKQGYALTADGWGWRGTAPAKSVRVLRADRQKRAGHVESLRTSGESRHTISGPPPDPSLVASIAPVACPAGPR